MTMYGLYIRDLADGNLVWFTTERSLLPGTYRRAWHHIDSPDVYIGESIPALVLQVGPLLDEAENFAQSSDSPGDNAAKGQKQIATRMTDSLLQRLAETSSIWVSEPRWLNRRNNRSSIWNRPKWPPH